MIRTLSWSRWRAQATGSIPLCVDADNESYARERTGRLRFWHLRHTAAPARFEYGVPGYSFRAIFFPLDLDRIADQYMAYGRTCAVLRRAPGLKDGFSNGPICYYACMEPAGWSAHRGLRATCGLPKGFPLDYGCWGDRVYYLAQY